MNRDDIVRMAKQASGSEWSIFQDFMPELERFAAIVATAEREACARMCEEDLRDAYIRQDRPAQEEAYLFAAIADCAAAIRARGKPHRTVTYVCPVCAASLERQE